VEDLRLEEHEKNYLQMKTEQQLQRYHSDFRGGLEVYSNSKQYKSPVLEKIKRQEYMQRVMIDKQEEQKQRLFAKKNQYAKYVNDFIRPQIKQKSQDKIL
jgi:hypothetical protein